MARQFNGIDDHITNDNAPVSGPPLTIACWFNMPNATNDNILGGVFNSGTGGNWLALEARGDVAGDPIRARAFDDAASSEAVTATGFSANTWHHGCAVFRSNTDRSAYIDGGSRGNNSTSRAVTGLNRFSMGRAEDSTPSNPCDGLIAEVGVWDVALTDAEIAVLGAGYAPPLVRPQNLVRYYEYFGRTSPEIELMGGFDGIVTGTTLGDHPRIIYPRKAQIHPFATVVAGTVVRDMIGVGMIPFAR